jgi:hypothetical protein
VKVTLTWAEVAIAARIGEARTIRNRANGNSHRHNHPQPGAADWTTDIEAACAEVAAAKGLGYYMPITTTPGEDRLGDLGYGIHVRHTAVPTGHLILHPDDPDEGYFVLVVGEAPAYQLPGFLKGADGKDQRWWKDPTGTERHAFFIPQSELVPIEGLVAVRPINPPSDWKTAYERNS